ncbi:hypothetical protein [Noviherbaspirillum sedimenti]|uniref:hypothetical protein n=1 Tax=Noviherbaspirillum sedimenti TaxID=2320865 RepID=UPI0013149C4F|nr:hypothetical protein [Noviherbaspirillum sedimenti]
MELGQIEDFIMQAEWDNPAGAIGGRIGRQQACWSHPRHTFGVNETSAVLS